MQKIISLIGIFLLGSAIFLTWHTFPGWIGYVFDIKNSAEQQILLGTFGDSFGALNTLFSGLAFAGIIVSIFLQSKELSETRGEIKAQGNQFKLQTQALNRQVFETTLFQLISLHNEILDSVTVLAGADRLQIYGRAAVKEIYLKKFHEGTFRYELDLHPSEYPKNINEYYMAFHEVYGEQIGHYFRNIYQIINFIDKSEVSNKKFYSNLLRAQMSSHELGLLFYNCLSDLGREKFKPLIEKYSFFEHLPLIEHIAEDEIRMYALSAYGETNTDFIEIYQNAEKSN